VLAGKTAWVTGASRGIGRAIALEFARQGAKLILTARNQARLDEVASQVSEITPEAMPKIIVCDVSDAESLKVAMRELHSKTSQLDIVVNNAGILKDAVIGMISSSQIDEVMRTNLFSVIQITQFAGRWMTKQKHGSIVNLASIVGRSGNEGQMVYSASKAAIIGATKSAAKELAPHNIRVNAVAPGIINTDLISSTPPEKLEALTKDIKLNRLGTPQEVAQAVCFLASDHASYITGQVLGVDGGMWL
jgi:3-oxoacyl-[acyl-carrier protein] reductase